MDFADDATDQINHRGLLPSQGSRPILSVAREDCNSRPADGLNCARSPGTIGHALQPPGLSWGHLRRRDGGRGGAAGGAGLRPDVGAGLRPDVGAGGAAQAAEAAAQAARDAAAAVEAGTATAAAAQAAIDEAAEAAAAAAAAAGEASAAAGEAAATAQQTAEAAAETAAAAVAAAEEAADAAREAAESAAMAAEGEQTVAASGGTWKIATSSTPNFTRLGLSFAGNNGWINLNYTLFNRLTRVGGSEMQDEGGYARVANQDFDATPELATGWEQPDELTYNFTIVPNAGYHSGRPLTAWDVAWVYNEIKEENVAGGGSPLNFMAPNLDLTEAIDDTTFQLTVTQPTGYIFTLTSETNIVDRETYDQREEAIVIGSGPFMWDNYDPNRGWDLISNQDYHGGPPKLDKLEFTIFADAAAAGLAVEKGDIHTSAVGVGGPEQEARLLAIEDHFSYVPTGLGGRVLRVRGDIEPTRDKRVRQAIMILADRERITREFAGTFDVPARLYFQGPPALIPELDEPVFDPATAGQLLDAAGVTNGGQIDTDILPERLDAPALAQLMQAELSNFGISMEIRPREYTEMITLQDTGTYEHMIIGFGNWARPGNPAVNVLFGVKVDPKLSAFFDESIPERERPGIAENLDYVDMIDGMIDGSFTDYRAFNEKLLDVAWTNVLFRQYGVVQHSNKVNIDRLDAMGFPYMNEVTLNA